MEAGASLAAAYQPTAEGGSVDKVSAKARNAGGIVGSVIDGRGLLLPENRIKTIQAVCW